VIKHVFVYGTLKRGQPNRHALLAGEFVGVGYVPGCALLDLGSFPGMVPTQCDNRDWTEGEIYRPADLPETLAYLDSFESEGKFYKRVALEVVKVVDEKPSEPVMCWTYLYMPKYKERALVEGGSW